jgi:formyl-CoA transferase
MPGALDGVKILDLTAVLLGPFATQHMADMRRDQDRAAEAICCAIPRPSPKMGPIYMAANRNKRSICLDLKKPEAVAVLKGMIGTADLFIHNSRPAAIERLGLGYEDLKKINPSIIYAYSLGYARRGPYGHKPAFDDLVQGVSGAARCSPRRRPAAALHAEPDRRQDDRPSSLHRRAGRALPSQMHRRGPDDRGADAGDLGFVLADRASVRRDLAARARVDGLRPHHQQVSSSLPDQGRLHLRAALHRRALGHLLRHRQAAADLARAALHRPQRTAKKLSTRSSTKVLGLAARASHRPTSGCEMFDRPTRTMPVRTTLEELLSTTRTSSATGFFTDARASDRGPITTFASVRSISKPRSRVPPCMRRGSAKAAEAVLREAGVSERRGHRSELKGDREGACSCRAPNASSDPEQSTAARRTI